MSIKLVEVTGIPHALAALKESKRHYRYLDHLEDMQRYRNMTDFRGFILPRMDYFRYIQVKYPEVNNREVTALVNDDYNNLEKDLNKLAKYGAGVGQEFDGAWYDAGHETLLRFIDFTFVVEDLHRGGMDDLDSHAKRFDNRIVRSSTRLGTYGQSERSPWYENRIQSTEEVCRASGIHLPETATINGVEYVKTANGYVQKGMETDNDVLRGNYPLSIPMSAIMRINFVDARHVYMRRNMYTHANPELRENIESLADQIEAAIPYDLGKLIRYDYAYDPKINDYRLAHIMSIKKVVDTTRTGEDGSYD